MEDVSVTIFIVSYKKIVSVFDFVLTTLTLLIAFSPVIV